MELQWRKGVVAELRESNLPAYQLLLPRQTNTHDCGLYMLIYIECLVLNQHKLHNLAHLHNRRKLDLFPRALVYSMRDRLRRLITSLLNAHAEDAAPELARDIIRAF